MLKSLQDKFANFAGSFYDWGSLQAGKLSNLFRGAQLSSWLTRHLSKRPALLGVELLVALSLTVTFYFLVRPTCLPYSDGCQISAQTFAYLSKYVPPEAKNNVQLNWRKRLAGPILSGWLLEAKFKDAPDYSWNGFQNVFGFYHATWLFLLFLVLIAYRKDALFIMFAVFGGLMYNLTDTAQHPFYYPWDLPTMFFFTLACLLYDRRRLWPLMVVVWLGGLFKETSLSCALLILLGEHWTLKKRVAGFAATVIATFAANKFLMIIYGVKAPILAMNDAPHIIDIIRNTRFFYNFDILFSLDVRHALFANAGSLLIILLIPWRNRRDVVFKLLIVSFVIGEFFCGIINEFRIWYEVLPLAWMLISETISNRYQMIQKSQVEPSMLQPSSVVDDRTSRVMRGSYWLMMSVLLVLAFGIFIFTELPLPKLEDNIALNQPHLQIDPDSKENRNNTATLSNQLTSPEPEESNKSNQVAPQIDPNSKEAFLNNLAWTLATSPEADIRDGVQAVKLAERACELTHYRETIMIGTLAAAFAEAGRFDDAISTGQKACALASELGETNLLKRNQELVVLYQTHQPYHEVASTGQTKP